MQEFHLDSFGVNLVVDTDTNVWITSRELERLFNWQEDSGRKILTSKGLKAFAGKDLTVGKNTTATVVDTENRPNKQKLYAFELLGVITAFEAVERKNPIATKLLVAGFLDSARSLVLEKAGIKVDAANREKWIKARLTGKDTRRTLTDRLKEIGCEDALTGVEGGYGRITRNVYSLAGVTYRKPVPPVQFRDTLTDDELKRVEHVESSIARLISNGKSYEQAYSIYKDLFI